MSGGAPQLDAAQMALCGGCARSGACRLGISSLVFEGTDQACADVQCSAANQGGPMVAHGGWTAAVFDDVLGRIPPHLGTAAVTATLEIAFLKPVPIERDLRVLARIDKREGRRWYLSGALFLRGSQEPLAKASGLWIARRPDHFDRHAQWLKEQTQ